MISSKKTMTLQMKKVMRIKKLLLLMGKRGNRLHCSQKGLWNSLLTKKNNIYRRIAINIRKLKLQMLVP